MFLYELIIMDIIIVGVGKFMKIYYGLEFWLFVWYVFIDNFLVKVGFNLMW